MFQRLPQEMQVSIFKKAFIMVMAKSRNAMKYSITAGGFSGYRTVINAIIGKAKFLLHVCYDWQKIIVFSKRIMTRTSNMMFLIIV